MQAGGSACARQRRPARTQQSSLDMSLYKRVCADMGAQNGGACLFEPDRVEEHDKQGRVVEPSLPRRAPRPELGCALVDEWANLPATSIPDDVFVSGGVSFLVSGELCAGTAALTKALGDVGFIAIPVDSVENILMQRDSFFRLDLNDPLCSGCC